MGYWWQENILKNNVLDYSPLYERGRKTSDCGIRINMLTQDFEIVNKLGLHARASALLVKTSSPFKSDIKIEREGVSVNGKSIMGIMMLAAAKGSNIRVKVDGEDEDVAMAAISELIRNGFGEE